MKELDIQRPTPAARRSSRATCENSTERMWWLVVTVVCILWFLKPNCARSLLILLCPLQSLCHAHSSGVNHNATARGSFSHLHSLLAATPGVQYHRGLGLLGGQPLLPIQRVEKKDEATWERIRGLGYSG